MRINKDIYLKDVLLVSGFTHNPLSVAQLIVDSRAKWTFLPSHCMIKKQEIDEIMGIGKMTRDLYVIEATLENHYCHLFNPKEMRIEKLHAFLGHPSLSTLKHMKMFAGKLIEANMKLFENCNICMKAKKCRDPFHVLN